MIKFLLIIWLSITLNGQTKDVWFPKEYGAYPGNYAIAPAYNENGGTIGVVIDKLEAGVYKSMSIRPAFRDIEDLSYQSHVWDMQLGISTDTVSTDRMESPDAHNYNTYNVYINRRQVNLPTIYPRFTNRGLDAIITEPFYPPLVFDRLLFVDTPTNACITIKTYNWITPYHFFDSFITFPIYKMTEGSKSTFIDTKCDNNQQIFEDYTNLRISNGQLLFLQNLYHLAPYSSYVTYVSNSVLRSPIRYVNPFGNYCLSMIDFDHATALVGNQLTIPLPPEISIYRLPVFAQQFAWSSFNEEDWYAGPTRLLVPPPLSVTEKLNSRMIMSSSDPGNSAWECLIFILTKI